MEKTTAEIIDEVIRETKPSIGVMPRWLHNEQRALVLIDAIQRCNQALPEWFDELRELVTKGSKS